MIASVIVRYRLFTFSLDTATPHTVPRPLAERWHGGVDTGADAGGPACGDGLDAGVEADAFGAVDGMVAEEGALPSPEAVEGHGHGDGDVDAHHAGLHVGGEGACGVAVAREDGGAVAELMLVDKLERGGEVRRADDAEDRSEDLFLVDLHLGLDVVEEAAPEEESFALRHGSLATVDQEGCSFLRADVEVAFDLLAMCPGNEWAEVGLLVRAGRDRERRDARAEFLD